MAELKFEPFNPKKHKPIQTVGRNYATEYTTSAKAPDGKVFTFPQIWFDVKTGESRYFGRDKGRAKALEYEKLTGKKFPRHDSFEEADEAAAKRSKTGGASKQLLAMHHGGKVHRGRKANGSKA